jgi:5-methylcytosine-specific restriction endonuclease McrA
MPAERLTQWGGIAAQRLTRAVLARDYDAALGFTPCHWCGRPASEFDHWPVGRDEGGPDTLANGVPACGPCNKARGVAYLRAKLAGGRPKPSRQW